MSEPSAASPSTPSVDRAEAIKGLDAVLGESAPPTTAEHEKAVKDTEPVVENPTGAVVAEAGKDTGSTPPESVQQQDLDWAPENLRPKLSTLDAEAVQAIKRGFLRNKDYTQKTQELAEARKSLEQRKEQAELWERLSTEPLALRAAMDVLDGKATKPDDEDDGVDILSLDAKGIKAYIAKVAQEKAERIAEERIRRSVIEPSQARNKVVESIAAFAEENGYDLPTMQDAVTRAKAFAEKIGVEWTPANAVELVSPFVTKRAATTPPARDGGGGLAKVASPNGRGATAALPPSELPSVVREKRAPKNRGEIADFAVHVLREHFGREATTRDLEDLLERR